MEPIHLLIWIRECLLLLIVKGCKILILLCNHILILISRRSLSRILKLSLKPLFVVVIRVIRRSIWVRLLLSWIHKSKRVRSLWDYLSEVTIWVLNILSYLIRMSAYLLSLWVEGLMRLKLIHLKCLANCLVNSLERASIILSFMRH